MRRFVAMLLCSIAILLFPVMCYARGSSGFLRNSAVGTIIAGFLYGAFVIYQFKNAPYAIKTFIKDKEYGYLFMFLFWLTMLILPIILCIKD